jgi:hypothetical protein
MKITKEWAGIFIGGTALVVSIFNLYQSTLRQRDELSVIPAEAPLIFIDDSGSTGVWGPQGLTLINSGNRVATITEISLIMVQAKQNTKNCNAGPTLHMPYKFKPVLVKGGEVVVKTLEDVLEIPVWRSSENHTQIGPALFQKGDLVLTCLRFVIATPDNDASEIKVPKSITKIESWAASKLSDQRIVSGNKPLELIKRSWVRF